MTSGATDLYAIFLAVGSHVTVAKAGGKNQIHSQIYSENAWKEDSNQISVTNIDFHGFLQSDNL